MSDVSGNVLCWSSSGSCGFKGSKKSTPFASQVACEFVIKNCIDRGIKFLDVSISGVGSGRDPGIRSINFMGISLQKIKDITSIPHNGCRAKKKRRV